jgi:hypothetical protein
MVCGVCSPDNALLGLRRNVSDRVSNLHCRRQSARGADLCWQSHVHIAGGIAFASGVEGQAFSLDGVAMGFRLQARNPFASPPRGDAVSGTNNPVTVPTEGNQYFLRLIKP